MVKILYFITDLGVGGAENLLFLMLKKLDRTKYIPVVCCFYGGELFDKIRQLGIKAIDLRVRSKLDFSVFFKFFRVLKIEKPDIVHCHLFHATIIGRLTAKLAKVPVLISTQHYSSSFHGQIGILAERVTSPLTDKIIAVSEAVKRFCVDKAKIPAGKIKVITNCIDLELVKQNLRTSPEDLKKQLFLTSWPIIGCVGRFVEIKGYQYLLLAAKEVISDYPEAKFILLGYGPLKNKLMQLAKDLAISERILFLKPTISAAELLSITDIYVLPSLSEGLSLTLLEAMAMAKPIVATDVGGNPEVIIDRQSGLIVPKKDSQALSKAIITILRDKELARKIASNARQRVEEKFNLDDMVMRTQNLYDSLISGYKSKTRAKG